MSIRVYNRFLDLLFEIDRYQSLQFKRDFHGISTFELHINRYINGADTLEKGNLFALNKQNNKVGIILTKEIALDEQGKATENFKLTGYSLEGLMQRRITQPPSHTSHDRISGSAESVMKHYVYNNFINTTRERQMPFLEIADNQSRGEHIKYESRYKTVSDDLENISISTGLGWIIYADFNTKKLIFDVVERKDRQQDNRQGNNPVFFSPEFETIKSQSFIDSDNDLRNVGIVGGQGEGVDRKIVTIGKVNGWDRIETFVDARDVSDKDEETEEELTDEEVEQLLIERGHKKMDDMETIFTLEAEILSPTKESVYEYEKDFDLGDIVNVVNKSWNLTMTAPITEITEIYEPGGFRLDAVFGRNRPTLTDKLTDKFNELEGIEKQEAPEKVTVKRMEEVKEYAREQDEVVKQDSKDFTEDYTHSKQEIDKKDEGVYQDGTIYTDLLMDQANKEIEDTKLRLTQAEKDLDVADEKINTATSDLERLEKELGEIEVGGGNLLLNSDFSDGFNGWTESGGTYTIDDFSPSQGRNSVRFDYTSGNYPSLFGEFIEVRKTGLIGENFTMSVYIYVPTDVDVSRKIYFELCGYENTKPTSNPTIGRVLLNPEETKENTGKWVRYEFTVTIPETNSNGTVNYIRGLLRFNGTLGESSDRFWYALPKLEKGAKATPWSPAPEDLANKIENAKQEIRNAQQIIDSVTEDKDGQTVLKGTLVTNEIIAEMAILTGILKGAGATIEELTTEDMYALRAIIEDATIKGQLDANTATMLGLTTKQMTAINAIIKDATITGTLNATDAIFQKGRFDEATIVDAIIENVRGLTGTFKDVTATDGGFNLQDANSGTKYSATPRRNLIKDHSFELLPEDGSSMNADSIKYNWLEIKKDDGFYDPSAWRRVGNPKVAITFAPDNLQAIPMFGEKAVVVRNANYVGQIVGDGVAAGAEFTVGAYFKRQWNTVAGIPRIEVWLVDTTGARVSKVVNSTFPTVKNDYSRDLRSTTFTVPKTFELGGALEVLISGGDSNWVQCDGAQMVEGDRPSVYAHEDSVWGIIAGDYPIKSRMDLLWGGERYPTETQTIVPDKTLHDCANGWMLQWQNYVKGSGSSNSQYQFTYVPKTFHFGYGLRAMLSRRKGIEISKYLYIHHDKIVGHASNGTDGNETLALTGVYEW